MVDAAGSAILRAEDVGVAVPVGRGWLEVVRGVDLELHAGETHVLVGESGIAGPEDVARLKAAGVGCFLVGESLMRRTDVTAAGDHA